MESKKIQAKEIKDDAILDIKVNKTFYLMSKSSLFVVFSELYSDKTVKSEDFVKSIISKKYEDMSEKERLFYTLTLLVGEIEKQALDKKFCLEKEVSTEDVAKAAGVNVEKSNED